MEQGLITFIDECASTNRFLLDGIDSGESYADFHTIYTSFQSRGYGQVGNSWESEGGKNLLFSTVLHPVTVKASEQFFISEAIALAVAETLDSEMDSVSVKWPNDIYWQDKKMAGILIENNLSGGHLKDCVIGVGLNVNQKVFRSNAPNPVSMLNITGKEYDVRHILETVLARFRSLYRLGLENRVELHKRYMNRLFRFGLLSSYHDSTGVFSGCISSVEPDGHLHITCPDGSERRYAFKEVQYIL